MSTPALIVFLQDAHPRAAIYRHWNGAPEIMLADLAAFAADVCADVPFGMARPNAERLAAQYLVWEARRSAVFQTRDANAPSGIRETPAPPLNFGSVWPVLALDAVDVDYAYVVDCDAPEQRQATHTHAEIPSRDADPAGAADSWPELRWTRVEASVALDAGAWRHVPAFRATALHTLTAQGRTPFPPRTPGA